MVVDGSPLLLTKLAPPPVRSDCVRRERLFERLDKVTSRRLVLVSTPAGFGKTTLLSSWYAARKDRSVSEREQVLAWLSLEPADNDPARFWTYILHALQKAHEETPDHPVMALELSPLASTETFLTALLNAFSAPRRSRPVSTPRGTILILDEYHVVTNQEIHTAVAFLLEHLPASLHLLIASRTYLPLPLTQLRAGGYLAEVGAEDMNFSAEETAQFLHTTLPLSFTTEEVARLQEQTDGWIMPLHLAALAWRGHQDKAVFMASLRGDHHTIVEYLMAEVFGQQPAEIQRFLPATSLMARFTGPLCDAVLQRTNSQGILQQLEREHLFLVPLEATHRWYRYHALFAGFLQDRLRRMYPEELALWHSQAADWYLQQEAAEGDAFSRALTHLPEQNDVLQADLLLNIGYAYLRSHDFVAAGRAFQDARRVGRRSGNMRAVMLASRYLAGSYVVRGLVSEAATVYRQALQLPTGMNSQLPLAAGTIYVGNSLILYERDDLEAALDQAQQGLKLGLRSGEMKTLFPGYLALVRIHQGLGDMTRAWQALQEAERLSDFHFFAWTEEEVAAAQSRLHLAQGEVDLAVRVLSRDEWQRAPEQALPFSVCPPAIQLAWARVLLAQHRPDAAAAVLQRVRDGYAHEQPQTSTLAVVALHALALAAGGSVEHAVSLLVDVLPPAIAQGYRRTFVDEGPAMAALLRHILASGNAPGVEALLAAFPTARPEVSRPTVGDFRVEPLLSTRELEVMRLLAAGMSNQQIADELVVALSTVRTHTKHIYRKLGVQGRVRAVARANSFHLL